MGAGGPLFPGSVWRTEKRCLCRKGCGDCVCSWSDVKWDSDPDAGFSLFCRVMKLEARNGIATSEVPKPEKEAELQSHFQTQEPGATSSSSSGLDAEVEPLQEESGSEAKAPSP